MPIIQIRMKKLEKRNKNMIVKKKASECCNTQTLSNRTSTTTAPYRPLYYIGYGRRMQQEKEKENGI